MMKLQWDPSSWPQGICEEGEWEKSKRGTVIMWSVVFAAKLPDKWSLWRPTPPSAFFNYVLLQAAKSMQKVTSWRTLQHFQFKPLGRKKIVIQCDIHPFMDLSTEAVFHHARRAPWSSPWSSRLQRQPGPLSYCAVSLMRRSPILWAVSPNSPCLAVLPLEGPLENSWHWEKAR